MNKLRWFASRMLFGLIGLWIKFIEIADLVEANKRLRSELRRSLEINKDLVDDWYKVVEQNKQLTLAVKTIRERWVE